MGKSLRITSRSGSSPSIVVSSRGVVVGGSGRGGVEVLVVALGLESVGELLAAGLGDLAVDEDVDEVGLDVAQDAGVVGDQQDTLALALAEAVDALGDDLQRVDVEAGVGLVEHRDLGVEQLELGDLVALLLATRETLVDRALRERRVQVEV